MASTIPCDRDLVAALKIPKFIRVKKGQPKPKYIAPPDVELEGELATKFMNQVVARTGHYDEKKLAEVGPVGRLRGVARSNPKLGKLLGVAFGRYWYVAG